MEIVTKIAPIILALIMFGLGLGLKIDDFTRVLKTPKDFIIGCISQLMDRGFQGMACVELGSVPPGLNELEMVQDGINWLRQLRIQRD